MAINNKPAKHKISLRNTLALLVAISLLGIIAFVIVSRYTRQQLLDSFGERSFALTSFTMSEIDRSIQNQLNISQNIATKISDSEVLANSNQEFDDLKNRDEYISQQDELWQAVEGDELSTFMQELIDNELSQQLREDNPEVLTSSEGNKYASYAEIIVTNKYGANIAQTNKTTDYYQADEEWWQRAVEDGLYVEPVELDSSADVFSIPISVAINNKDGDTIGAIKTVWNIEEIVSLVERLEVERQQQNIFGSTTNFTLLDKSRRVIFSSRDDLKFYEKLEGDRIQEAIQSNENEDLYTISTSKDEQGSEITIFYTTASSTAPVNNGGLDWTLVLEQDSTEILGPINTTERIIGGIIAIFIAAIAFLVYRYTAQIRRIQALKEEFVSMAAHQLKTPLTAMGWNLAVLQDSKDELPAETNEVLSMVSEANDQMNSLVNDLLNLSRLESGRLNINPEKYILTDICQKIIDSQKETAAINNTEIIFEDKLTENKEILLDESIFTLILSNLLSNAVKYGGKDGHVKVTVTEEKDQWTFAVSDDGMGIPEPMQKKIFQKFYRADNAEKSEKSGTGLGLYVIHAITEGLGGKMWFESAENIGSTFYFTITKPGMKPGKIKTDLA